MSLKQQIIENISRNKHKKEYKNNKDFQESASRSKKAAELSLEQLKKSNSTNSFDFSYDPKGSTQTASTTCTIHEDGTFTEISDIVNDGVQRFTCSAILPTGEFMRFTTDHDGIFSSLLIEHKGVFYNTSPDQLTDQQFNDLSQVSEKMANTLNLPSAESETTTELDGLELEKQ